MPVSSEKVQNSYRAWINSQPANKANKANKEVEKLFYSDQYQRHTHTHTHTQKQTGLAVSAVFYHDTMRFLVCLSELNWTDSWIIWIERKRWKEKTTSPKRCETKVAQSMLKTELKFQFLLHHAISEHCVCVFFAFLTQRNEHFMFSLSLSCFLFCGAIWFSSIFRLSSDLQFNLPILFPWFMHVLSYFYSYSFWFMHFH